MSQSPMKPEHADKVSPVAGAPRFQIERHLSGYAYPANGNVHNPSPRYYYLLLLDGKTVDQSPRERQLRAAAKAPDAVKNYSE